MAILDFGGIEILQIVEAVSREKSIPKERLIIALEEALKIAATAKYGHAQKIRVEIDRKTGGVKLYKEILVVATADEVEECYRDGIQALVVEKAKEREQSVEIGDIICEALPAMEIGRIAAQYAKKVIISQIKDIEREIQYEEYKDQIGDIFNCVVDRVEYSGLIVKIGAAEALIKRDNLLRADHYKQNDRIKACLVEIDQESRGPQLILSRTDNQFIAKLFEQEVPEIQDGIIQVRAVARDQGSRAKVAVFSSDPAIDPIGSCVGIRGARVQAVSNELKGEKIDIINWSADVGKLVIAALAPAHILKVLIDEDARRIEVVVAEDQQSIAIGRQGQNVKLASQLTTWRLDILTEEKEAKRRLDEFNAVTQKFMVALDLEEILAQLLASEGYNSIQSIMEVDVNVLSAIHGLDVDIAQELIERARHYSANNADASDVISPSHLQNIEGSPLLKIRNVNVELAQRLHEAGINSIMDVADLSRDDFKDSLLDLALENIVIDEIIMDARNKSYSFSKRNNKNKVQG